MDVIECAIRKESEARTWYEQLAATVTVPALKELFSVLAASEDEHFKALCHLRDGEGENAAGFVALDKAACAFRPLLDQQDQVAVLKKDPDGYRQILAEEEETIRLYEELAAHACDESAKSLLDKLVAEEKRHLNIVENIFEFVESPRTYLAWGEFSNLREY